MMVGACLFGVCESYLYADKAGVDLPQLTDLLSKGGGTSFQLEVLGPRIMRRDFTPGGTVDLYLKDLNIALQSAKEMGLALPQAAMA